MRIRILLLVACCGLSAVSAQSLETTIWLPDSLSGVADLGAAAYSPASNRVYIGGRLGGRVAAVDAATRQKLCNIEVDGQIGRNFATDCMVYVPGLDRVLCAVGTTDSIVTIDCATNTVVGRFAAGSEPGELLYNEARGRVYCASKQGNSVLVINPATSTVERSIAAGQRPGTMALNIPNNRLYVHCAFSGSIAVIDCGTDSVIATLPYNSQAMLAHPTANRVYISLTGKVGVLDAVTNQLVDSFPVPDYSAGFAHVPTNNHLYVMDYVGDSLLVFDCATNGRVAAFHLYRPYLLHYNGQDNKIYCACNDGTVAVIDCVSNSIVATLPRRGYAMVRNTVNDQLWLLDRVRNDVAVVDGASNSILGSVVVGSEPSLFCYNPQRDKLYCADQLGGRVYVIDAHWLGTARMIPVTGNPAGLVYNPAMDHVYCSGYTEAGGSVHVIDCATDSLIASVPVGHGPGPNGLGCSPVGNKVYAANGDQTVTVVDCATNQVASTISTGASAFGPFCYNSVNDKLYLPTGFDTLLTIIDCAGDSVLRQLVIQGAVMCYSQEENALYMAYSGAGNGVAEKIDGATDSIISEAGLIDNSPSGICYCPENGLLYVAMDFMNWIEVVDLAPSQLVDTVPVGNGPGRLLYNSINNKVYCANAGLTVNGGGTVSVIDCSTHTVTTTIRVGDEPVDLAWYEARNRVFTANHGGSSVSVLLDAGGAVAETPSAEVRMTNAATVVRGVLFLPASPCPRATTSPCLLDVSGRKVMELRPGANDVSILAPGVYFVRATAGRGPSAATKIVIQK